MTNLVHHRAGAYFGNPKLRVGGVQRRVELDPFKVVGRFTIAEQKHGKAASEAFKALDHRLGRHGSTS